jgi:cytochrome c-type protein NapB
MMKVKSTISLILVFGLIILAVATFAYAESKPYVYAESKIYTEEELGIRQETLFDERETYPAQGYKTTMEPGESERFQRSFENSPPLVPHDLTGMLPLGREPICLDCHMPQEAVSMGATPIPKSHFTELGTGKDLKGKLDGDRYNCLQCHVTQNRISPPIANLFKGEFRDKEGRYRSNLLTILNEGVEAE